MRIFLCWIIVAVVVLASACTTLETTPKPPFASDEDKPQTVDNNKMYEKGQVYQMAVIAPGAQPESHTAEAGLWMLMNHTEEDIKSAGNLVRDEGLNRYIRGITCKLAGPYCSDIRVYLLRVPEFNAMLAPNGIMVIWTGTLLRITNEAQLAAVM